jgi:hypothetical protein
MSRSLGRTVAEGLKDFRADPVVALVKALALRPRSHASPMTTSMTSALRAAPINSASNARPRSSDTVSKADRGTGRETRPIQKLLGDAGIKLDSVVSDILGSWPDRCWRR